MNNPGIYYPQNLSRQQLDVLLARGWYRMGQGIMTCDYLVKDEQYYRAYWLRYDLTHLQFGVRQRRLMQRNQQFSMHISELEITPELESLFTLYRNSINFETSPSIRQWLCNEGTTNIFDSYVVELRDNGLLVAAGVYDSGENSMAGILSFYNPAYKKYSPGKYLLLSKIKLAMELGKEWFYPGYVVTGMPKFDYKLYPDKAATEVFLPEMGIWLQWDPALLEKNDEPETQY